MKDHKDQLNPRSSEQASKTSVEEYRERLELEEMERLWLLEALDCILSESEEHPEEFHQDWIEPLLSAGLSVEAAFSLLIGGRFRPN